MVGALLAEAAVLSAGAGLLGLALAYGGIRLLLALNPTQLPRLDEIAIDPIVIGFVLAASAVAALLFGLLPVGEVRQPAPQHHAEGRRPRLE